MEPGDPYYITTPIYYVNEAPHIGHVYTTLVADVAARTQRLRGRDVWFLTGTDEHAAKVVDTAAERGVSTEEWAARNAEAFREVFAELHVANDDFIRTSEDRHKRFVQKLVADLVETGDIYLGEYEGWYDAGQEEYVPDGRAREHDYKSPVTGRPLEKRTEENYFFRLSAYQKPLEELYAQQPDFVQPVARRNEVLGRLREGLADVPISRAGGAEWGIRFPGAEGHLIYVWIDALINYATAVEPAERRHYWPPAVHLIAKDILWFHTVIWPALLLALQKVPGDEWLALPHSIYVHSYWVREGQKMSKSLGNFVSREDLRAYAERFSLDALRWFLVREGPLGTNDSDFAEARFLEVYNHDLANTVGNSWNRIVNMTHRYLGGRFERAFDDGPLRERVAEILAEPPDAGLGLRDLSRGLALVQVVDAHIEATRPFALAKEDGKEEEVARILYECAETFRLASLFLWPALPDKMEEVWRRMGRDYAPALADRGRGRLAEWSAWGGLAAGTSLEKGPALFPRAE